MGWLTAIGLSCLVLAGGWAVAAVHAKHWFKRGAECLMADILDNTPEEEWPTLFDRVRQFDVTVERNKDDNVD